MKRIIYLIFIILFCGIVFLGCEKKPGEETTNNNNKQETIIGKYEEAQDQIYKEYKTDYDLKSVVNDNKELLSSDLDITNLKLLDRVEAEQLYGIEDYEITVLQSTEGSFTEICSIKVKNTDNTVEVLNLVTKRIENIKTQYPQLTDEYQFTVEMNKGIITFVAMESGSQNVSDVITACLKGE